MAVLQAYQADLLKQRDEGQGLSPDMVAELRHATDLDLADLADPSAVLQVL